MISKESIHEAWWSQENEERPLFLGWSYDGSINTDPSMIDLIPQDAWFYRQQEHLEKIVCFGDAFPYVFPDVGSMPISYMFGANRSYVDGNCWNHSILNQSWDAFNPKFDVSSHPLWKKFKQYLSTSNVFDNVCIQSPDWGCVSDTIYTLRGSQEFLMDLIMQPERIVEISGVLLRSLTKLMKMSYELIHQIPAHGVQWLKILSKEPYIISACDVSAMVSSEIFRSILLPIIAEESSIFSRAIFHLDGPDAMRHIDDILTIDTIKAVQFSPPPNNFSAIKFVDLFKKILNKNRSVLIFCPPEELLELMELLPYKGVAYMLRSNSVNNYNELLYPLTPEDMLDLHNLFLRKTQKKESK